MPYNKSLNVFGGKLYVPWSVLIHVDTVYNKELLFYSRGAGWPEPTNVKLAKLR